MLRTMYENTFFFNVRPIPGITPPLRPLFPLEPLVAGVLASSGSAPPLLLPPRSSVSMSAAESERGMDAATLDLLRRFVRSCVVCGYVCFVRRAGEGGGRLKIATPLVPLKIQTSLENISGILKYWGCLVMVPHEICSLGML